jgi:DNA primase
MQGTVSGLRKPPDGSQVTAIANHGPGLVPERQEFPVPLHPDATKAAIKNAVDIVALVGEYLPLRRAGSKFKALCPFHDDHNPSLELNPDRQSFKCWSCGAGGDVFDFVKSYEHVDFPEALRMLADRAGVVLDRPSAAVPVAATGPSKSDLIAVQSWAEGLFARALTKSDQARAYLAGRGLTAESIERFRLGYAEMERGWLQIEARTQEYSPALLEQAGLVSRPEDSPGTVRERFRGRLIFPIHDERGRPIGFGGRILPEMERAMSAQGKNVAKYLNSPETALFQKRKILYAADLARAACREAGWVAVVEGYTDVIAAHQVGLCNVVGTLGTALGADHVQGLRRLADRVVLVFDGDTAGQSAADRALEFFLGHELDVRVLSLPANLDPCEFLLKEGAEAFRDLVSRAVDPLAFVLDRAALRFDLESIEGSRRAAEWMLGILSRIPSGLRIGLDLKLAKSLDSLAHRLSLPVESLRRRLRELQRTAAPRAARVSASSPPGTKPRAFAETPAGISGTVGSASPTPIRVADLDPIDRELVQIVLNEPGAIAQLVSRVVVSSLRDAPLRAILQTCYDLYGEGQPPLCEDVLLRLEDPHVRALAAALTLSMESAPLPEEVHPASWEERLKGVLATLAERERQSRLRELERAKLEAGQSGDQNTHRALQLELLRLMTQKPNAKSFRRGPSL